MFVAQAPRLSEILRKVWRVNQINFVCRGHCESFGIDNAPGTG